MSDSRTEIINIIKEEFGYINPSDYTSVDFAVRYFESRTCAKCLHHNSISEYYGSCVRNGEGTPTEYTWFCAGWEKKK